MADEIDFDNEVVMLLSGGNINTFMAQYLKGMKKPGLNEDLWQEAIDDAVAATSIGVDTEQDFLTFFYIDHFVEDLAKELFGISLTKDEEENLKKYMFSIRKDVNYSDLLTFKTSILKWMKNERGLTTKQSYPNRGQAYHALPKYDLQKWIHLAELVSKSQVLGFSDQFALREAASNLGIPERYDFLMWFKYYVDGIHKKYNVNDIIKSKNKQRAKMASLNVFGMGSDDTYYYIPKFRPPVEPVKEAIPFSPYSEQDAADFESVRKKMLGRVFSIDKLIEKYRKVLSEAQVDAIESVLNELKSKVRKLKLASTVQDAIIKTANILEVKCGFIDGANELRAIAADEEPPVVVDDAALTKEGQEELARIFKELTELGNTLKTKGLVRELAKLDLQLHSLNMASFFPELMDAQSRLIEAFGYASNKIQDVLPKMRGGLAMHELGKTLEGPGLGEEVKELTKRLKRPEKVKKEPEVAPVVPPTPVPVRIPAPVPIPGPAPSPLTERGLGLIP